MTTSTPDVAEAHRRRFHPRDPDATASSGGFVVLDSTDVERAPIETVPLPQRLPFGLHRSWIPDPE